MAQHGSQDADAVADGVKVRFTAPTGQLEAGNLGDTQTRLHGPHGHLGLDFEAGRRKVEVLEVATVECAESVAQIGQVCVVDRVEDREQEPVAEPRNRVMSNDPPPLMNRDPLTKS